MSDVPSRDELALELRRALARIGKYLDKSEARAILDAVLPLVVGPAVTALEPFKRWAGNLDEVVKLPGGMTEPSWSDDNLPPVYRNSATVGDLRRARSTRDGLAALASPSPEGKEENHDG